MGVSVLLALQHILAAFAGIIAVPLVVCTALGFSIPQTSLVVSASIFVAGIATFIQSKGIGPVGARVPGMMGTDFTFVNPTIAVGSQFGMAGIVAATLSASIVEIVLSRFIKPLMRFFPPLITGTVVALIGITLLPVSMDWAAGGVGSENYGSLQNLSIACGVMALTLAIAHFGRGILRAAAVFIGMVVGYLVCIPLGLVNLSAVGDAPWFALPNIFAYGFHFNWASTLAFVPAYIVSTIGTVGIMMAIGQASGTTMSSKRVSGGCTGGRRGLGNRWCLWCWP